VLIEKYIPRPRHIEVQVFGDTHGNIVHLFERDCSLQRRHQKVIEEAPAPGMDEATREQLCAAAVKAAKAVDYVGAGTIEFIADASEGLRADRIWFMEMNTRLQVEHPVTEEITGVDLVEWQLRVASGEALPKRQDELSINGWAMEARLYAEDPAKGFLPSVGTLSSCNFPHVRRIESGVVAGSTVSPFYDPMIAKLVAVGETREDAAKMLKSACVGVQVRPVSTNAHFLARAVAHPEFLSGSIDTGFIERHFESLTPAEIASKLTVSEGALLHLHNSDADLQELPFLTATGGRAILADERSVWNPMFGFRLNARASRKLTLEVDGQDRAIDLDETGLVEADYYDYEPSGVWVEGEWASHFIADAAGTRGGAGHYASDGTILSPMPGKIIAVEVTAGQSVIKGQKLLTLEAMKMEHTLTAPFDGVVAELNAEPGAQVQVEALLARIEAAGDRAE
jgi:3-methylcrotonyl-CoA carboxylase alpha subunit